MKRSAVLSHVLLVTILSLASGAALAGPNAGGTLVAHDTGLVLSIDPGQSYPSPPPFPCLALIDPELPLGPPADARGWVWKVYAAFPYQSSPRLKALVMGATFPADVYVIEGGVPDPVVDFEIPQDGWPATSGGGVGISLGHVQTGLVIETYWLGGYAYGAPVVWSIAPHPTQEMIFVDDSVPPLEDPILALGSIGFGMMGHAPCPPPPQEEACCLPDGTCYLTDWEACDGMGGVFYGGDCDPSPCPPGVVACCFGDSHCEPSDTFEACLEAGGYPLGWDIPCDPNPCPGMGACCHGEECVVEPIADCYATGGVPHPGIGCEGNPCAVIPVQPSTWGRIKADYR
ncbi:MAG: hypothetical protein QUU85_03535 [Candidatus Eisenbacteria bacterium]|nr:hypothetical protein [Candidatus Eisenbacteria bacterium]